LTSTFASGNAETFGFDYDASGNLTSHSTTANQSRYTYGYDDQDRLTSVVHVNAQGVNDHKSEYVYDSFGRKRISREYGWDSTANSGAGDWVYVPNSELRRIYQGRDVVQERDGQNRVLVSYTRAGNIGGLLARTEKANTPGNASATDQHYYYHYDGSGNVVQLTDAAQNTVADYAYDAYGNTTRAVGAKASQPYRFSTKEWQSASGLYDYGFRFYNPGLGRWLNRDPLREGGGLNVYAAFGNSPTNLGDSYGLSPMEDLFDPAKNPKNLFPLYTAFALGNLLVQGTMSSLSGCGGGVDLGQVDAVGSAAASQAVLAIAGEGAGAVVGEAVEVTRAAKTLCFVAGTPILMADGSTKPIEEVKQDDKVLSRDAKTGKTEVKRVEGTTKKQAPATVVLTFENGKKNEKIETTKDHPFYVEGKGFVKAGELGIGTSIVTRAGPSIRVLDVKVSKEPKTVYNFSVQDFHTYFVGNAHLWVHNPTCWTSPDPHVADLANAIEARYPGLVVDVNTTFGGNEVDILLKNAIIEVKQGGSGLARQVAARASSGLPVIGYSPKLGRFAAADINAAGGIAAGGKASTLSDLLDILRP